MATKSKTYARFDEKGRMVEIFGPLEIEVPDMEAEPDKETGERPVKKVEVPVEEQVHPDLFKTFKSVPDGTQLEPEIAVVTDDGVRQMRDTRLAATDWTQLADVDQATRDLWAPYRAALRDVPAQPGFPTSVDWPTPPKSSSKRVTR